ncbi:MAG: methyltransferase family protein [Bryobacteraceae bacterium]
MSPAIGTILFTIVFPGTVTVLIPYWLLQSPWNRGFNAQPWIRVPGVALIAAGVAAYLMCASAFVRLGRGTPAPWSPPRRLVADGLYVWSRNPMYVAVVLLVAGEALAFDSVVLLAYSAVCWAGFQAAVLLYEEPKLRRLFGAQYQAYCRAVPRWLGVGGGGS